MTSDVIRMATLLMHCPSITPVTAGVYDIIEAWLIPLGFISHRMTFEGDGSPPVENLYLRYGTQGPNFCFAGHTDVVPPGDEAAWRIPPFAPHVVDGKLYGRGAEDMKGAIAAFMVATKAFIAAKKCNGSISMLITQDEEAMAINGTKKMLKWLAARNEKIDACLVGEPTNPDRLGDMIKIGRRGSIYFTLDVHGIQGHAAYPERADNPVTRIVNMLHAVKSEPIDKGTEFFPPSNLEITSVDVGNPTGNIIPAKACAKFNVRFNDLHTGKAVEEWVRARLDKFGSYALTSRITGEAFLTRDENLANVVSAAVKEVTGKTPVLSTTGGTSDARFIKDCCPVVEFGTTNLTAHQIDEHVNVETLEGLAKVYEKVLENYFNR